MTVPAEAPPSHSALPVSWAQRILPLLGPAFVISIGPGSWATDIESGARFGYTLLWVLLLSNLIAVLFQSLSARLGIVTGHNLSETCREHYARPVTFVFWAAAQCSTVAIDLAMLLGGALGFSLLLGIPFFGAALLAGVVVFGLLALERNGYRAIEYVITAVIAIIGLAYLYELVLARPHAAGIARGLAIPNISNGRLYLAIGVLGATVMPHAFLLRSDPVRPSPSSTDRGEAIRSRVVQSAVPLGLAFLVNAAILIMSATTFFAHGSPVRSIEQAHQTLTPLLGGFSAVAFAIALLAAGLGASMTRDRAGDAIRQGQGVGASPYVRRLITIVPALILIYLQVDALKTLVLSQVCLAFGLPFAIVPLIHLTGNRHVMGELANGGAMKTLAWTAAGVILLLDALLVYQLIRGYG